MEYNCVPFFLDLRLRILYNKRANIEEKVLNSKAGSIVSIVILLVIVASLMYELITNSNKWIISLVIVHFFTTFIFFQCQWKLREDTKAGKAYDIRGNKPRMYVHAASMLISLLLFFIRGCLVIFNHLKLR